LEDLVFEHATAPEACSDDDMVSLGSEDHSQVLEIPSPAGFRSNLEKIGALFNPFVFQGTDIPRLVFPTLIWNAPLCADGVLFFSQDSTQVSNAAMILKSWTLRYPDMSILQIIAAAIIQMVPFRILLPLGALNPYPYPNHVPYHNPLTRSNDMRSFVRSWKMHLVELLAYFEARAFLLKGGIVARVAIHFGGLGLIKRVVHGPHQQFPANQFTTFAHGTIMYDDDVTHEQLLALLGSPSAESQGERKPQTLFPTPAAMESHFWRWQGCWNDFCESLFQAILKDLEKSPTLRSEREWGRWIRFGDHNKRDQAKEDLLTSLPAQLGVSIEELATLQLTSIHSL